jgi:predicted Fe-S protein YdhL (DUF1289 family)
MARSLQITCDGCGRAKQESNHWWCIKVRDNNGTMALATAAAAEDWLHHDRDHDFCGQSCVLKFIAEQMGKAQ